LAGNNLRTRRPDAIASRNYFVQQLGERSFEGKGQNFHFIPTSRHDDMKRASHTILLEAMANKL
jgi:hypothetical protein